jgi:replicative DNA helicase
MLPSAYATVNAEQHVIGALLLDASSFNDVADVVTVSDFSDSAHRVMFSEIREMVADGETVDVVMLCSRLANKGRDDDAGGISYIASLASAVPTAANAAHYARFVQLQALRRRLDIAGVEISELAKSANGKSADELVGEAKKRIDVAAGDTVKDESVAFSDLLQTLVDDLESRDGSEKRGLPTGLLDLDEKIIGLRGGDLIVVAGRPSTGKTTLAMNIALHNALDGKSVFVASLEMSALSLTERAVASVGRIDSRNLKSGKIDSDDWRRVAEAQGKMQSAKLHIDGASRLTVERLRARCKRVKARQGLALVLVDYIQLMDADGNSRNEEIASISRGLKLLAKELDVPLIALSQLSRKCEDRTDKRPMLSDLRDSGAIEQDADIVLTVYRDELHNPSSNAKNIAEINVAKNREGETGRVYATFLGRFNRFENTAYRPQSNPLPPKKGFYGWEK